MGYLEQQQAVARQRRLADLLRAQSEQTSGYQQNPGQMVSGRYVAPAWSQNLAGVLDPIFQRRRAAQEEAKAASQEQAYGDAVGQARQQWQSALPRTIAGHPELQGPQASSGSPELAAAPNQIPNRETVLKHTLMGLEIPGNEKAAALWNQGMGEEWQREDKQKEMAFLQKERQDQAKALRLQQLEQQERELRAKLEQDERQNIRDNETRRMHQQTLLAIAQMRATERASTASAKDDIPPKELQKDTLKFSERMKQVAPVLDAAQQIQDLLDANIETNEKSGQPVFDKKTGLVKYKPIPGIGYVGVLPSWARSAAQEAGWLNKATNPNRATVERLVGNIMRNQAGLSQTTAEQARVLNTMLTSGSYGQDDFTRAWGSFTQGLEADLANLKAGHYPESLEEYNKRGGRAPELKYNVVRPTNMATQARQEQGVPSPVQSNVQLPPTDAVRAAKQARLEELRRKAAGIQ